MLCEIAFKIVLPKTLTQMLANADNNVKKQNNQAQN